MVTHGQADSEDEYIHQAYTDWLHRARWTPGCAEVAIAAFKAGWEARAKHSDDLPPWRHIGEN